MIKFKKEACTEMTTFRRLIPMFSLSLVLLFSGCGMQLHVKPDVPDVHADFTLHGKLNYEGNINYVPKTISNKNIADSNLSFSYAYNVLYGGTTVNQDIVTAFIPATLFGAPTGASDVQVRAKLDVFDGANLIKSYVSACNIVNPRGLFVGGTDMTEVRKRGLMAVKENIESQMVQDKDALVAIQNNKKGETK